MIRPSKRNRLLNKNLLSSQPQNNNRTKCHHVVLFRDQGRAIQIIGMHHICIASIPCNTAQTILFYNRFPTLCFCWFSVVDFKQLKSNWNSMRKNLYTTIKNPIFQTKNQPFWNVANTFFNSCCVTRDAVSPVCRFEEAICIKVVIGWQKKL